MSAAVGRVYLHVIMQQQSLDTAISTADLISGLAADDPKCSFLDVLTSTGQVAGALSLCWMIHLFV